ALFAPVPLKTTAVLLSAVHPPSDISESAPAALPVPHLMSVIQHLNGYTDPEPDLHNPYPAVHLLPRRLPYPQFCGTHLNPLLHNDQYLFPVNPQSAAPCSHNSDPDHCKNESH